MKSTAGLAHQVPSAGMAGFRRQLGMPQWFLANTPFADTGDTLPDVFTLSDFLAIACNILDAGYRDDFVESATLMTKDIHLTALAMPMFSAPTLRDVLELLQRFGGDRAGAHRYSLHRAHGRTFVALHSRVPLGRAQPMLAEVVLAATVQSIGRLLNGDVGALLVSLRHERAAYSAQVAQRMGCRILFGQEQDGVELPTALEASSNRNHDEVLLAIGTLRCAKENTRLREAEALHHLRTQLRCQLAESRSVPSLARLAAEKGCSVRTLIRRLRAGGVTYQQLVDSVRREYASEMLAGKCSVSETANALGFSDPSCFRRSFRRWYGVNPRDFAKRQVSRKV